MQLPKKNWCVLPPVDADRIAQFPEMDPVILQYLTHRGLSTQQQFDEYLLPDYSQDVHDPFLFRDMRKAVDRIMVGIAKGEKMVVYGDYDGDGICGSGIMMEALRLLGATDVELYLPHRATEGYGLNIPAVEKLAADGRTLLITVDCGSTSVAEVERAGELGMEVIIIDHHARPQQLPDAMAIINPVFPEETYPWKNLCGGGTAFKVAQALFRTQAVVDGDQSKWEREEKWLLDLAAISTVMDMIPLVGESRTLVKYGLIVLRKTRRLGLRTMYERMGTPAEQIDVRTIGFQIGPRINAAGRINHASAASKLLLAGTVTEAEMYAAELETANVQRQKMTSDMITEAVQQIGTPDTQTKLLTAMKPGWEAGVIGLVASRIMDRYGLPAIIMGIKENGEIVGSGRSLKQFNITKALQACAEHLRNFGGHPQACGFTMKSQEDLEPFLEKMRAYALAALEGVETKILQDIEAEISFTQVNWELMDQLMRLEPYGYGAPKPAFLSRGVTVERLDLVGSDKKHAKLILRQGETRRPAIAFGFGEAADRLQPSAILDIVYEIDINEWNGNRELQLKIIDIQT